MMKPIEIICILMVWAYISFVVWGTLPAIDRTDSVIRTNCYNCVVATKDIPVTVYEGMSDIIVEEIEGRIHIHAYTVQLKDSIMKKYR